MKVVLQQSQSSQLHTSRVNVIRPLLVQLLQFAFIVYSTSADAIPIQSNTKTFGHSIKNGPLPANEEVTTFEHHCQTPP